MLLIPPTPNEVSVKGDFLKTKQVLADSSVFLNHYRIHYNTV